AGGVPAVMKELARGGLLHLDEPSITGRTIGEHLESVAPLGTDATTGTGWCGSERVVFPLAQPLGPQGGIAFLRGNLAPDGAVVLHVAPEAAVGGPLGLVRTGDWIELDVAERRLHLEVAEEELARRRAAWQPPASLRQARGYTRMYVDHVLQADTGADFDFL